MKSLLSVVATLAAFCSTSYAATQSVEMNQSEIQAAIEVFNLAGVKGTSTHGGACFAEAAIVSSVSRGMNPASWTIFQGGEKPTELTGAQIPAMIALFDRVGTKGSFDGIAFTDQVVISESSCGMSPATWTVTFDDGKN
jgi:hypothetical protein